MHDTSNEYLLQIEPKGAPTEPIDDALSNKVSILSEFAKAGETWRGVHRCTGRGCEAISDNVDWIISGYTTNSLAFHYISQHRDEVPASEIAKLEAIHFTQKSPNA